MDDPRGIERVERRRRAVLPGEIGVALVLEDRHTVLGRQLQQSVPTLDRHDRAGRVLDGRDRVNELRGDPPALQVLQDLFKSIHADAVVVERGRDDVGAEPLHLADRPAIGELLNDHRIAGLDEGGVEEIHALQRARRQHDVVGRAGNAAAAPELGGDKLA